MFNRLTDYLDSIKARDPAARSRVEIALLYPGVRAMLIFRAANWLWTQGRTIPGFRFVARLLSEIGRLLSGIEIHPGANIGKRFFIDHGLGVVIGETAIIHDDVTLYHGVTLGGIGTGTELIGRRHPELESGVVVGAGAQVLGPIVVHHNARVGANAVVLKDVAEGVTVVGIPAQAVDDTKSARLESFAPYGAPSDDLPDPTAKALCALTAELQALRRRVDGIEAVDRTHGPAKDAAETPRPLAACGPEG